VKSEQADEDRMWWEKVGKTHKVNNFFELHEAFSRMSSGLEGIGRLFRGQSQFDWRLVPKSGRGGFAKANLRVYFNEWKQHAIEYLLNKPQDELEWLAIAQHHGFATNLLDWTYNPLAAAFFAVQEEINRDAAIIAYRPNCLVRPQVNPFTLEGVYAYQPTHVTQRIKRQMGAFTIHDPPTLSLDEYREEAKNLEIIIIDCSYKKQLLCDLATYGVNQATLFPDLDGLSMHINWKMLNYVYPQAF